MNEWSIYIALYCVLLYTQSALQSYGGSLLNHHQCAASTWMMMSVVSLMPVNLEQEGFYFSLVSVVFFIMKDIFFWLLLCDFIVH